MITGGNNNLWQLLQYFNDNVGHEDPGNDGEGSDHDSKVKDKSGGFFVEPVLITSWPVGVIIVIILVNDTTIIITWSQTMYHVTFHLLLLNNKSFFPISLYSSEEEKTFNIL